MRECRSVGMRGCGCAAGGAGVRVRGFHGFFSLRSPVSVSFKIFSLRLSRCYFAFQAYIVTSSTAFQDFKFPRRHSLGFCTPLLNTFSVLLCFCLSCLSLSLDLCNMPPRQPSTTSTLSSGATSLDMRRLCILVQRASTSVDSFWCNDPQHASTTFVFFFGATRHTMRTLVLWCNEASTCVDFFLVQRVLA